MHSESEPDSDCDPISAGAAGYWWDVARTVWKGSIAFGLVNIPVGLYPATEDHTIHFHQFESDSSDRIRLRRVNERTGEEVDLHDIVKGYDLGGGSSVIVTPDELDSIAPKRSSTIEIVDFVDLGSVDPIYFQTSYYLVPSVESAVKAYALLRKAMAKSDKAGIAPFVMRGKEYLSAVRADGDLLVLETMHFDDEIRPPADLVADLPGWVSLKALTAPQASGREVAMATQLIESLSSPWKPSRYKDTYRSEVERLVEAKRKGRAVVQEPAMEQPAPVVDLMEALTASVKSARSTSPKKPGAPSTTRADGGKRKPALKGRGTSKSSNSSKAARPARSPTAS
jgi:DNA end-binding protein Ku